MSLCSPLQADGLTTGACSSSRGTTTTPSRAHVAAAGSRSAPAPEQHALRRSCHRQLVSECPVPATSLSSRMPALRRRTHGGCHRGALRRRSGKPSAGRGTCGVWVACMLVADGDGCRSQHMSSSALHLWGQSEGRAHKAMVRDCSPALLDSTDGSDGSPAA